MRTLKRALAIGLICATATSASADTSFGAGAIIIPASATYQTDCGAVSLYGFIYNILRSNAYLEANKVALGIPGQIEVYYAFKDIKGSPNRCTPTNQHAGPAYPGVPSPTHADLKWNDGCDFEVFASSAVPVKKIVNTSATNPATDLAVFNTISTTDATHTSTSSGQSTYPNWPLKAIQFTGVPATNVDRVRYWGGSFIINDQDAPTLRALMQGTLVAKDAVSGGNDVLFTSFNTSACTYGTTVGGQVNLHAAQVAFTAPTPKILTVKPPRLALLGRNANQNPLDGTAFFFTGCTVGGGNCRGGSSKTGRVADTILEKYLARAGLTFAGANGCAIGGYLAVNHPTLCPTPNATGQIYDLLDFRDLLGATLATSKLGAAVSGVPLYKMFWAPHWEFIGASANSDEQQALTNIAAFADGQAGVMAECASISAFEGSVNTTPNMNSFAASQFQTCTTGACANIATGFDANTDPGDTNSAGPFTSDALRNCTDPDLANGSSCAYFSSPGDGFSQIGDYRWNSLQGVPSTVADFKPNAGAQYRPGVNTLVSGISVLDNTKLTDAATVRTMAGFKGDFVSRSFKDNNTAKSNILYLGLHDETSSIAGTKIALQTLLLLGDAPVVPVFREVTRANPILARINSEDLIVQGSFEQFTPAPTTKTANNDTEAPTFEFPFLLGHLRGIRANLIAAAGVELNALPVAAVAFDGGENIPAVTFAGCGASAFTGGCRTVFTNTASGQAPPKVFVQTGGTDYTAIKDLVAPGLTAPNQQLVVERVLKGSPNTASPGTYISKLGGVDHSTVAVVAPSAVTNSARPTMIYVGATDGMMHAFCATVAPTFGCDIVGRELWAFLPRVNLPRLRKNTARIDGSARVADLFGDFNPADGATSRTFKTVLLFQTGTGDSGLADETPAVYALDITNPKTPSILWEYVVAPGSRLANDVGQGVFVTQGTVQIGGAQKLVAFVQTNNGGTNNISGSVVSALNVETPGPVGTAVTRHWITANSYPNPPRSGALPTGAGPVPIGGIPGGAIGVDKTGGGAVTDVVYGSLYGEIWQVDAANGTPRYGGGTAPLFRFSSAAAQDKKPFGVPPALFSDGTNLFVALVSGGYYDPFAIALWSGPQQHLIGVSLSPLGTPPLDEGTSAANGLKKKVDLTANEKGFSQVIVVGDQLIFTTDTTDVNSLAFGATSNTGFLHQVGINAATDVITVIDNGASSVAFDPTTNKIIAGSGSQIRAITPGSMGAYVSTKQTSGSKIERQLWLQTL